MIETAAKLITIAVWLAAGIMIWYRAKKLLDSLQDLERQMRKEILGDAQE